MSEHGETVVVVGIAIMISTLFTKNKLETALAGIAVVSFGLILQHKETESWLENALQQVNQSN